MKLHFKFVWERFVLVLVLVLASRSLSGHPGLLRGIPLLFSGVTAIKIDRTPLFDVGCWTFDVQFFLTLRNKLYRFF